jgi:hypothetical protein
MAYVKAAIKHAMRDKVSTIDGVGTCWIERCTQNKDGTYEIDIRISDFAILEEISQIFRSGAINVNGGYDEGCPTCGGDSYVEVGVSGATFSPDPVALRQAN